MFLGQFFFFSIGTEMTKFRPKASSKAVCDLWKNQRAKKTKITHPCWKKLQTGPDSGGPSSALTSRWEKEIQKNVGCFTWISQPFECMLLLYQENLFCRLTTRETYKPKLCFLENVPILVNCNNRTFDCFFPCEQPTRSLVPKFVIIPRTLEALTRLPTITRSHPVRRPRCLQKLNDLSQEVLQPSTSNW